MSLQALWWRSFFSSTKQLPNLPCCSGGSGTELAALGALTSLAGGHRAVITPGFLLLPPVLPPHRSRVSPQAPQLCTSLCPWDPAPFFRRALSKWTGTAGEHGGLLGVIPEGAGKGAVMGFCRGWANCSHRDKSTSLLLGWAFPQPDTAEQTEGHPRRETARSKNPEQRLSQGSLALPRGARMVGTISSAV